MTWISRYLVDPDDCGCRGACGCADETDPIIAGALNDMREATTPSSHKTRGGARLPCHPVAATDPAPHIPREVEQGTATRPDAETPGVAVAFPSPPTPRRDAA